MTLAHYYYDLDREILQSAISTNVPVFITIGYFVAFPTAILFGELRLLSNGFIGLKSIIRLQFRGA